MSLASVLVTDRLVLRPPVPGDLQPFMAYTASPRFTAERGSQPAFQRWGNFATLLGHWQLRGWGRFLVTEKETGRILGHLGPLYPEGWPEPEIAWHLWHRDAEGKGHAFEAARAVLGHAFGGLGWSTAVSYIADDNVRSRRLAERLGATVDADAARPDFGADAAPLSVWRHRRPEAA